MQNNGLRISYYLIKWVLLIEFIPVILCCCTASSYAQEKGQGRIDSLVHVLRTAGEDSSRVELLNSLATEFMENHKVDSAMKLSFEALMLSKKISFKPGEANSYFMQGKLYSFNSRTAEGLKNYQNALELYEQINQPEGVAEAAYAMGIIYHRSNYEDALRLFGKALEAARLTSAKNLIGNIAYRTAVVLISKVDYNQAVQYIDMARKYYNESGNEIGVANCYVASARIHDRRGNFQQALADNYSALRLFEKTGNKLGIYNVHTGLGGMYLAQENYPDALNSYLASKKAAEELNNQTVLSGAYNNVGNTYLEMGNNADAQVAFEKSLQLAQLAGDKKGIATAQGNLGIIFSKTGRPMEAIKSYERTIEIYEEIGAREGLSIGYLEVAKVYFSLHKPDISLEWANRALQTAKEISYKDVISRAYLLLAQIDTLNGNHVAALEHYKQHITYRDSITNADAARNLIEQRMQYSFSKKEDSLKMEQELVAAKLEKQTLLTTQQQQELRLRQAALELARRDKDLQMLSFLKTQAELQLSNEQKEKELTLAEQEKALQQSQLERQKLISAQKEQSLLLKDKELSAQRSQRNLSIAGATALFLFSFFIFLIYRNQRNANGRLQQQQAKTEEALKELKAAQAQLIQSEKMASLGELTAGIAHEIQNPLNFVNNFSDLNNEMLDEWKQEVGTGNFKEAAILAGAIKENNSKINHHGKRADAIVKAMLEHSRSGSRSKEPSDINMLADEYLRLSYHGLRAKNKDFNASLLTDFDEDAGSIEMVPQDIGRVLLNLYNNAFYAVIEKKKQHGPGFEPTVLVTTRRSGEKVAISVRDNGTGIPEKALGKIYQPFFTTKPTGQGTGLGLSLSYDIIKAHGGELKVETKEGEFSEFTVQLPAGNPAAQPLAQ